MATEKLYIAKLESGEELGPVDQDALIKLAEAGTITSTTTIRSKLIPDWNKAGNVDFLKAIIFRQRQAELAEQAKNRPLSQKLLDRITLVAPEPIQKGQSGKTRLETLPIPSIPLRLMAGVIDLVVLLVLEAIVFVGAKTCLANNLYLTDDNAVYITVPVLITVAIFYFTLSIALMTQTVGQRFCGYFLIRINGKRFWICRAFFFSCFLLIFGIFSPLFFLIGLKTYPEILTRTRFAKVINKKKH